MRIFKQNIFENICNHRESFSINGNFDNRENFWSVSFQRKFYPEIKKNHLTQILESQLFTQCALISFLSGRKCPFQNQVKWFRKIALRILYTPITQVSNTSLSWVIECCNYYSLEREIRRLSIHLSVNSMGSLLWFSFLKKI